MMKINKENYEAYLLDLAEGNLSAADEKELKRFLEEHPELQEDFEDFEFLAVPSDDVEFSDKASLKMEISGDLEDRMIAFHEGDLSAKEEEELHGEIAKSDAAQKDFEIYSKLYVKADEVEFADKSSLKMEMAGDLEDRIIAYHEGDLSIGEEEELRKEVAATDAEKDFELYGSMMLQADEHITFPDKTLLKKKAPVVVRLYPYAAAAAAILLLLFFARDEIFPDKQGGMIQATQIEKRQAEPKNAKTLAEVESKSLDSELVEEPDNDNTARDNNMDGKSRDTSAPLSIPRKQSPKGPVIVVPEAPAPVLAQEKKEEKVEPRPQIELKEPIEFKEEIAEQKPKFEEKIETPAPIEPILEEDVAVNNEEYPKAGKALGDRLLRRVLGETVEENEPIDAHSVVAQTLDKYSSKSGRNVSYRSQKNDDDEVVAYSFNVGRFGFERVRGNR